MTALPSTEDLARLAALSAKLRSHDPIPSRSEIAAEIDAIREFLDRRDAEVARECWNDPPCEADAEYIPNAILTDMETLK